MDQFNNTVEIIILAAGKGTRMKSDKAKVLHPIAGLPMINHVVDTAVQVTGTGIVIVIGHQADKVKSAASGEANVRFALQKEQMGTGHAVQCALPELSSGCAHVVILSGDVPLIKPSTIINLIESHIDQGNDITVLGVCLENPFGYGRIIKNPSGGVEKIVEESDADEHEKKVNIVNSGIYCVKRNFLELSLSKVKSDNMQNEIYLTDIVGIANSSHKNIGLKMCTDPIEVMGVNTLQDLMNVETMLMES